MKIFKKILAIGAVLTLTASMFTGCKKSNQIAIMTIKDFGEVKIELFANEAPKAVENFTTHAKDGYYDGLTFHRVIADFMIQGGDPEGTGMGGESIWGEPFEDEFSSNLRNFTGALSMANSGANTNGSQFFIVNAPPIPEELLPQYSNKVRDYSDADKKKYAEVGGTPWLDNVHTVFGQVYEGMDVVKKVMETEVGEGNIPTTPVVIESIEISTEK